MNDNDIMIMEKYKREFLSFLDYCISIIGTSELKKIRTLQKIKDKIAKAMNSHFDNVVRQ
ncbi:Hypothetical protein HVR_LOCUS314 [uncultured virus]|nr:Hypothetical protein HVR_LOCUS314 [uncultured virus]